MQWKAPKPQTTTGWLIIIPRGMEHMKNHIE
jgi:hypothetical protein